MYWIKMLECLFSSHGYFVIFVGLILEFIALPFPGETTMAYAGYLSYKGIMHWQVVMLLSFLGTTIGITITYWIGRKAGLPFIRKYGKWVFLPPRKLETTRLWFEKYGASLIFIGYFIPGVRHFTGYFSGIITIPFRKFMLYAYSGALVWTALFVGIGKIFGPQWNYVFHLAATYSAWVGIAVLLCIVGILCYRYRARIGAYRHDQARHSKKTVSIASKKLKEAKDRH
ncbi:membrane protein DedA with SNARE-associated domain [Paenibacillus shirakamiensis]|uniref:Membrane protein DedA with SNARE-associated domain n=1 Tax=Paenibacillus shirakamiensis TaxID=1265935 RepID=A0ABS4JJ47_9BACL|nr:DedA family protein [Paenibacillus shirakamiensis]MBP2001724.1 membrane protein DedA with SNARE-associated domain [Paenibacillus shirakamiensis]